MPDLRQEQTEAWSVLAAAVGQKRTVNNPKALKSQGCRQGLKLPFRRD